jgi:fatty-acyl-CoA synthase
VADAAAAGIPGRGGIEEVGAIVVLREPSGGDELMAHCRARLGDRAPARIVTVAAIPRNAAGKILRTAVRDLLG